MKINSKMLDFTKTMSKKEIVLYSLEGLLILVVFAYFFYRSIIWLIILLPLIVLFLNVKSDELVKNRQWILLVQFKEMIISMNSSIQAGYSVETSCEVARDDMRDMYGNNSYIVTELNQIIGGLKNNIPIEYLLNNMAKHNNLEEIESFANLMSTYKKTGGNIVDIIQTYVAVIEDKVSLRQEIETMISAKKYEQRIMNIIPFVILFYVNISSRGFFDALYHNIPGNAVMTIVLAIYLTSIYWSGRIITNII